MSVGDEGKRGTGKGEGGKWGSRSLARRESDNATLLVYELTDAFFSPFGSVWFLGVCAGWVLLCFVVGWCLRSIEIVFA